ncbi:insulinase family protein [Pelagicoccus sp. SDUM812003]|uniref:M16 family metallopeptidase n=1 Tax=Pelagicoccus sp. SDUM812003 TaxID=3041267 RepID=UPI00280FE7DE|nr:insulinase family protein [Pelagicoccus sp. SDUM812003]MDQ8204480.1 insulinase family protein [Pelagicoccus sp. SDUM812003]
MLRFQFSVFFLILSICRISNASPPAFPHQQSDIPPNSNVRWGRLENGFRYAILPQSGPPQQASLLLLAQAGSYHETPEQSGYAHFVEHMVFEGTRDFPGDQAIRSLEALGLSFGAHANATTKQFETSYNIFNLPLQDAAALPTALRILRGFSDGALFEKNAVKKEARVILNELLHNSNSIGRYGADPSNPFAKAEDWNALFVNERDGLFDETRVESRTPGGNHRIVKRASARKLRAFYQDWYRPERMILALVGDVDPEQAEKEILATFASLASKDPGPEEPPPPVPCQLDYEAPRLFARKISDPGISYVSIANTYPKSNYDNLSNRKRDLALRLALDYVASEVDDDLSSFVNTESSIDHLIKGWALPFVRISCREDQIPAVALKLVEEMNGALLKTFDSGRFEFCRTRIERRLEQKLNRARAATPAQLASALAYSIARGNVFADQEQMIELERQWLQELTLEESQRALQDLWQPESATVLVNSNQSPSMLYDSDLADLMQQVQARKLQSDEHDPSSYVSQYSPIIAPHDLQLDAPGSVSSERFNETLGANLVDFENGVRLIVKQLEQAADRVEARVQFGYGALATSDRPPGMSESIVFWAGAHTGRPESLQGKTFNLSLTLESKLDCFEVRFSCPSANLPESLDFVSLMLRSPQFGNQEKGRALLESTLHESSRDLEQSLLKAFFRQATSGHFLFRPVDSDYLRSVSAQEMVDWLSPMVRQAPMEIALVGNIAPDMAKDLVARTFGALPERNVNDSHEQLRRVKQPELPIKAILELSARSRTDGTVFGWLVPQEVGWRDDLCRDLILRILRLRATELIRSQRGQSYSPTAYIVEADPIGKAGLLFLVKHAPKRRAKISKALRSITNSLQDDGFRPGEIEQAKEQLMHSMYSYLDTSKYWLDLLTATRDRLSAAEDRSLALEALESISADEVYRYLQKHLAMGRRIEVASRHR